ncbi:MAG: hypothetical protein M1826_003242 [Phylliscum demangeonii]|nr:MAG: hypothetical protein M1826_003242 [Phylliscum demangeonii]
MSLSLATIDPKDIAYQLTHWHDDRGPLIVGVNVALALLAAVAVILRFWARRLVKAAVREDDYAIVVALALYAYELIYAFTLTATKLSILFLYQRIFPTPPVRIASYGVAAFVILNCLGFVFAAIVQCQPIAYAWDKTLSGKCFDYVAFFKANTASNIFSDVLLLIIPLFVVWSLRVTNGQKVALTLIFMLGSFVCVASAVRLPYILQVPFGSDPTWTFTLAAIWTSIEVCTAIVCACLIVMRPLFRAILPDRLVTEKRSKKGYYISRPSEPAGAPPIARLPSPPTAHPLDPHFFRDPFDRSTPAPPKTASTNASADADDSLGPGPLHHQAEVYLLKPLPTWSALEWGFLQEARPPDRL